MISATTITVCGELTCFTSSTSNWDEEEGGGGGGTCSTYMCADSSARKNSARKIGKYSSASNQSGGRLATKLRTCCSEPAGNAPRRRMCKSGTSIIDERARTRDSCWRAGGSSYPPPFSLTRDSCWRAGGSSYLPPFSLTMILTRKVMAPQVLPWADNSQSASVSQRVVPTE